MAFGNFKVGIEGYLSQSKNRGLRIRGNRNRGTRGSPVLSKESLKYGLFTAISTSGTGKPIFLFFYNLYVLHIERSNLNKNAL